ncbi:MAG: Fpg/Nei family DNA glycosylase [Actinomycetes bacterium]
MPEGDTVWLAAKRMDEALRGKQLQATDFRVPQLATVDLAGRRVIEVVPRGKHLLTRIEGDLTLHTHFRMDGSWHLYRPDERWRGGPDHQVRAVLRVPDRVAVAYRMPVLELLPTPQENDVVGHLGPDVLGADWDAGEAVRRLASDPAREIGQALLDQRNLAGVGNLYKAEALFVARTSPWQPVSDADIARVVDAAATLLQRNRGSAFQNTTGRQRRGEEHWVFERRGRPCLRCGTPVSVAMQGEPPYDRFTYWCRRCQPGPAPSAADIVLPSPTVGRTRYRP